MKKVFYMTKRIYWDFRSGLLSFVFLNLCAIIFTISVTVNYCQSEVIPLEQLVPANADFVGFFFAPLNTTPIRYISILMLFHFVYAFLSLPFWSKYKSRVGRAFIMRYVARLMMFSSFLNRYVIPCLSSRGLGIILNFIIMLIAFGSITYSLPFCHFDRTSVFLWTLGDASFCLLVWTF